MDGDELDREVLRLAIGAAGAMGGNRKDWMRRVAELTAEVAAMFRPLPDDKREHAFTPIVTARKVRESSTFLTEFVRCEDEPNTHRMVVYFKANDRTEASEKEADGTESMRTEPAWTRAGAVMQTLVKTLVPGQECMVYKYVEPIEGGRKKVRVLVHLEPRRKPKTDNQTAAARPPTQQTERPPVAPPEQRSAPAGDDTPSPPSPAAPSHDPRAESAGENEAITTRFNALAPRQRVAFGRACSEIPNFMNPALDDLDKVLLILGKIERGEPPTT